jgi:hypothetical protein
MPAYARDSGNLSHGAKTLVLLGITALSSGKCLPKTSLIVVFCTHSNPSLVYISAFQAPAMNRSLFSRLLAMRMKMRNAVSLKPKPSGSGSL